jgi:hypothetical protein
LNKYPASDFISAFLLILGWIGVGIGLVSTLWGLYNLVSGVGSADSGRGFGDTQNLQSAFAVTQGVMKIAGGVGLLVSGLVLVFLGESIKIIVDIEHNTWQTSETVRLAVEGRSFETSANEVTPTGIETRGLDWSKPCKHSFAASTSLSGETTMRCRHCGIADATTS